MMKINTVEESLYWSYANLGMAHAAVRKGDAKYHTGHFIIRNKLYTGFRNGTMNVKSLADDERLKLVLPQACCYCGSKHFLAVDHLIPRKKGGLDKGDNMVWSCRSCNSSKCATDVLEWLIKRGQFPPLLLLRRYLKISIDFCIQNDVMNTLINEAGELPFSLSVIPHDFPQPAHLTLWITD
jgi:hypothetical protein